MLSLLRRELAAILRDRADDEAPEVAAKLRAIAADFETGLTD